MTRQALTGIVPLAALRPRRPDTGGCGMTAQAPTRIKSAPVASPLPRRAIAETARAALAGPTPEAPR